MSTWMAKIGERRELRLSRLCWMLAALSTLLALIVLLFIPEVSVLSQPDGTRFFYIDRQVDLPTGDPAVFSDYSLLPLCAGIFACSVFFMMSAAYLRGRRGQFPDSSPLIRGNYCKI